MVSPGFFTTGSASPVSRDSSTSRLSASATTPSTTTLSPGPSSIRSPRTISEVDSSAAVPSRRTLGLASPMTASPSRVFLARSSWMMPMPVFATITKPKRLSWIGATKSMITHRTPMIALKRVKTLARTMSTAERELRTGTSLTSPRATRSATSAEVSPAGRCSTGGPPPAVPLLSVSIFARCVMLSTVRPEGGVHLPERGIWGWGSDPGGTGGGPVGLRRCRFRCSSRRRCSCRCRVGQGGVTGSAVPRPPAPPRAA